MSPLTAIVFILALGSLNCLEFENPPPEVREHCINQEGVAGKELRDLKDNSVKCYYHCIYEKMKIIVNGNYVGNDQYCKKVKHEDKCELASKVVFCRMFKG